MTTAHAKLNLILDATAADARKARIVKSGFFTRVVVLIGCLICIALGQPADTFERMADGRVGM